MAVTGMRAQGIIQVILLLSEGVDHRALQIAKDPVRYVSQIGFQGEYGNAKLLRI